MLSVSEYAKKFDMAVLAQDTTESVIRTGCERARDYRVAALPDVRHLQVMTSALGGRTRLKLSGVPRTFALAATLWMLDMGVDLIGTRSAPDLVDQYRVHVETSRAAEKIPARV